MKTRINSKRRTKLVGQKIVFFIGFFFVILGIVGVFLPGLPTTPFLIIATTCFVKSSPKAYQWLVNHPLLGNHVLNFVEGKGLRLKVKIWSLLMMSIALTCTLVFVDLHWIITVILLLSGVVAIVYMYIIPTQKNDFNFKILSDEQNPK